MRYYINFNKTINQFVPHYFGGRKLILYLQALMKPLQQVGDDFSDWADETKIEAAMTSQIFKFEWFLNRKLSKYFLNPSEKIYIKNGTKSGTPIYLESADIAQTDNLLLYEETESPRSSAVFRYSDELTQENMFSFLVYSPAIDTQKISTESYTAMLAYWIDKYRLAGKTYNIIFKQ